MWVGLCHLMIDRPLVRRRFSTSAWPRDFNGGAEEHDEADHRVGVAESVGDADQQLDLVVHRLDPGVAQSVAYRVEDVLAVAPDLPLQFDERRDAASLGACDPPVEAGLRKGGVPDLEDDARLFTTLRLSAGRASGGQA